MMYGVRFHSLSQYIVAAMRPDRTLSPVSEPMAHVLGASGSIEIDGDHIDTLLSRPCNRSTGGKDLIADGPSISIPHSCAGEDLSCTNVKQEMKSRPQHLTTSTRLSKLIATSSDDEESVSSCFY